MKIFCKFPTINISKCNFWLVICIAKDFIWTTLKAILVKVKYLNVFLQWKYCNTKKIDLIFLIPYTLVTEHERLFCSHFSKMCFQLLAHTVSSEINIRSLNSEGSAFKETLLITEKPDHWEPDCRTSLRPANEWRHGPLRAKRVSTPTDSTLLT